MLKVGGSQNQTQPQDFGMGQQPQDMPIDGMPPMDPQMMGGDQMQGAEEMPPMDNMSQDNDQSQFDTNFDAGVEADEDTDPKKYIQQLTGKLSTTLNNFNNENDDQGLNKYVAKMIVKASTKNMDDADKKEVIKAINTSSEEEPVESNPDGGEESMEQPMDNMPQDNMQLQEKFVTKKQLSIIAERIKSKLK